MKTPTLAAALAIALFAVPAGAEVFVDVGAQTADVEALIALVDDASESSHSGLHLGVGVRRAVGERGEIGARLELDEIDSERYLRIRVFDYAFRVSDRFAVTAFAGAARLDLATPAYGYYVGAGVRFRDVVPRWDLGLDLAYGDKVARDNLLPSDPQGGSPDNFYDVSSLSVYLSYRFGAR